MGESKNRPVIYYIRHGQTDWNAERRFQGRREVPLNETGLAQARSNGERLRTLIDRPEEFDFVASPLGRARQTMEIIRTALGLDPSAYRISEALYETSYGDFEGSSADEIRSAHPDLWQARSDDRWTFQPPNGESLAMTLERIAPWLDALASDTVIVAHGALGRAVRHHLIGLSREEAAWFEFPQDRIFRFDGGRETVL